jgi:membrane-associated phospholipid phosphatase
MEPVWNWGNDLIVSIQAIQSPVLHGLFNAITFLGEAEFLLLIFPLLIWSVNKPIGLRVAYLVLTSITINTWAKISINHPRPFEWPSEATSPVLKLNNKASGPGIPSGHTQSSLVLWFYLAYQFRKPWLWVLATILFGLVSFSRVYLGVHFPTDLLGGAVLGLIILLLFIKFEPRVSTILATQPRWLQVILAIGGPLIIISMNSHPDVVASMSTISGFSLGLIIEQEKIGFQATGSIAQRAARFIVGIVILALIFFGLDSIEFSTESILHLPFDILRFAIAGFWVSAGAPWLFKRLNLVE